MKGITESHHRYYSYASVHIHNSPTCILVCLLYFKTVKSVFCRTSQLLPEEAAHQMDRNTSYDKSAAIECVRSNVFIS